MQLIYKGNSFKYQTEAVMKLFLPAQRFGFTYLDDGDTFDGEGDSALMTLERADNCADISVTVFFGGKTSEKQMKSEDISDDSCEFLMSKLLYLCMSELTGMTFEWGILTGVRPVKQVHRLMEKGLDREGVFSALREKYLVTENKCSIAYQTAAVQKPILDRLKLTGGKTFGLYVSIPFCPTRCSYCSFISQSAQGAAVKKLIPLYIENLCDEIRTTAEITASLGLKPDTVYFGGGTPTTLSAEQLARIMRTVAESFDMSLVTEYTIEAGRPDTVTAEKLAAIKENGCTRISVNPQTLNNSVLQAIGRSHTAEQFFESFELARKAGFNSINTDIIAGLPTDTPESFRATMDGLIRLSPESITVHTLSIKRSANLNSSDEKQAFMKSPASLMVDHATEQLGKNGYLPYYMYRQKNMVDNLENIGWVKPSHESLYNIYIMEEVQTIIAVGAAASTKLVLPDGNIERIFNFKYPVDYNMRFETVLKRKAEIKNFFTKK